MTDYDSTSERMDDDSGRSSANAWFIYLCHVATYEFARRYVDGKNVLDFGCGTGYGTALLAEDAASIVGVDPAPGAIAFATRRYGSSGDRPPRYLRVDPVEIAPLPFPDGHFDTVVSFQVIEHVPSVPQYLAEIRRVLKPGGTFVCATPDRTTRLFAGQQPFNMFHVDEWSPSQFHALVAPTFDRTELFGMTAPAHVLHGELRRCRRVRTIAYPFTFRRAPHWWRSRGLRLLKRLDRAPVAMAAPVADPEAAFGCGLHDIKIAPHADPSVNIISVSS